MDEVVAPSTEIPQRTGFIFNLQRKGSNARTYIKDESRQLWMEQNNMKGFNIVPFTSTSTLVDAYRSLIKVRKYGPKLMAERTTSRNRWSTLSNILNWSKLISAASLSIYSMIKCTKWRLFWIVLPFTTLVCFWPIKLWRTACKWLAKILAKIFNFV